MELKLFKSNEVDRIIKLGPTDYDYESRKFSPPIQKLIVLYDYIELWDENKRLFKMNKKK